MDLMYQLERLLSTYGSKLLYYTDTTDGYREITDSLGDVHKDDVHKAAFFSGTATGHLHVRFVSFQISQTAQSHLRYTLEAVTSE